LSFNNTKTIRRSDKSFEIMDNCMRVNIELKTNLRAMENTKDNTTFSLGMVAMVQTKDNKRASYNHKKFLIQSNLRIFHDVPKITKQYLYRY
jgi:hypothetical protein